MMSQLNPSISRAVTNQRRACRLMYGTVAGLLVASQFSSAFEGFESASYTDWTVSVDYNPAAPQYYVETSPNQYTPTSYTFGPLTNPYIIQDIGFVDDGSAVEGNRFLQMTVGGGSSGNHSEFRPFTGPDSNPYFFRDRSYRVALSRDLYMDSGNTLSLWANFYTDDYPPSDADDLRVSIDGTPIFELSVADVFAGFPEGWESGWTQMTWTAPASGSYTLSLSSYQDDQAFSSASFDDIMIVPEPATGLLMVGMAALAWRAGRSRNSNHRRQLANATRTGHTRECPITDDRFTHERPV